MKICHINMFYYPTYGGVEQVMYELAKRQVKEGHEVHVFCCDSDKHKRLKVKEEIIDGVHVHRLPYWFRLSLSTFIWPSLLWKLPKYKFDIIHTHVSGHVYVLFSGIIAKLKNTKHVHTTHCPWTDAFRPFILKPFIFLNNILFNRLAYKLTDKIIAITPWEIPIIKKYAPEEKITVIPNGVDEILFKKIKNNNFKKENNIKGKMVLFFGRFNPTKGPDKLVEAFKEILKERNDIALVMVGPDEGVKEKVKEMSKGYDRIIIKDPIRDKKKIAGMYQAADVYVLPSYREGMPLTLIEAMSCGVPIIASPVNGVPFEMKEPNNGYFVSYGDIKGLKEKILKILDNKEIAKKISLNNKNKAKNYTWNNIAEKYMGVYIK